MIELEKVYKSFDKLEVLKGVSINVKKGEVAAIIGPSGSGKSTLLRCINFLETPQQGKIRLDNLEINSQKIIKSEIRNIRQNTGMVFQNYNLFKHKTVVENLTEGLIFVKKLSKKKAYDTAMMHLEKVGLADRKDFYPSQLSGGQQQRVGIARALSLSPKLILFDEPTSALDPELVGEVLEVIKSLAKDGITMIIVTHEIQFAKEVAHKIYFMDEGHIIEEGKAKELIENPKQERTKIFLKRITGE